MDKEEALKIVNAYKDRVVERYHPLYIILFGSILNDQWVEESDIDVAVIMHQFEDDFLATW